MKALKHGRWGSYLATLQTTNVTNSVWSNAMKSECFISLTTSRYLRNHTMTPLRSAGQRSLEDSTFEPEISQNVGVTGQSVPYLEAYNLMEENADIIFDQGNMMNERAYNIDEVHLKDSLNPRPASELPGPKSWPMVGCLPYMIRHKDFDPQKVYLFWRTVRKEFGPIFRKDMPGHPNLVFITDPADLQVMLQSTMYNPIRPGMQSLKKIRGRGGADGKTNTYYHIFGDKAGILAEQGEEWWRVRREVQKPVTNVNIVSGYLPKMNEVADSFIERIRSIRNEDDEMPDTFNTELYKWSLESIGTVILERRLGCLDPHSSETSRAGRLAQLVRQLLDAFHETENVKLWQYFPTTSIKKLQEAHDIFTQVALEAIQDTEDLINSQPHSQHCNSHKVSNSSCPYHQQQCLENKFAKESKQEALKQMERPVSYTENSDANQPDTRGLLETLLKAPGLNRGDVLTFLLDMLSTGIDTTSHTVGNMLYLLARHPKEQDRLREEILRVVPYPQDMTQGQLSTLTYTKAVFRETMRLMPVNVGITRKLVRDTVLGGYLIPKGWQIVMPTMLMNHQESVFPRASEFLPERFLRGSEWAPKHNFAFLPFSSGPRMCIGRRIAYQEIISLIVRIIHEFDVDYKYEDVELVNKLAYGPSCPLKFTFYDRVG